MNMFLLFPWKKIHWILKSWDVSITLMLPLQLIVFHFCLKLFKKKPMNRVQDNTIPHINTIYYFFSLFITVLCFCVAYKFWGCDILQGNSDFIPHRVWLNWKFQPHRLTMFASLLLYNCLLPQGQLTRYDAFLCTTFVSLSFCSLLRPALADNKISV